VEEAEEAEEQEAVGGTADIKSNNPHLTGGEKPYTYLFIYVQSYSHQYWFLHTQYQVIIH